ncbi:MAG: Stp1/IreP family PP2C-type Ser/Thr phosphatase [Erysipelotrichaceae bacterium]|nr:Stp1/IreP family PP2C-type Ser/Thr phosphatase [Erysipelotrichaceae bacterium]MDY6035257.1 Stp1/IreP family PP2C-type Ser/Thr phosphatase [Bulleidia sp.]
MKYYGITDKGLVRKSNQDSYVIATNTAGDVFAIVADGIGGNLGGDIASRMAVAHFSRVFAESEQFLDADEVRQWLNREIKICNSAIFDYGKQHENLKGMGTTLCAALITQIGIFIVNIGDSRAYAWWHRGQMQQLTVDHTLVNDMLMHHEITPEEAKTFPRRNVLTNALGVWEDVKSDINQHIEKMDGLLLCSDGLHGYVPEKEILKIVIDPHKDTSLRARKLVKAALDAGGYDNVTAILLDFSGGYTL